jgi:hypothetical protein
MSRSSSIAATIFALAKLSADVNAVHTALVKHERALMPGHQQDAGRAELYGMLHRLRRLLHELKNTLAEPAPSAAR